MREKLTAWEKGEVGVVLKPLAAQAQPWRGAGEHSLRLAPDTFSLAGDVQYAARQSGGDALPAWLKFDAKTQTFSGNPPAGKDGYTLEVSAVDAAGANITDRFVLQLDKVNDAPLPGVEATILATEGGRLMRGKLDAVDPDGDPLEFSLAARQNLPAGFSFKPDGQWQFDPADPHWRSIKAGGKRRNTVGFKATDPHGESGSLTLNVEVTGVNNPPEVDTLEEIKLANNASPAQGRIPARDVDEDAKLSFEVLSAKTPEGFSIQADGQWRFDPAHPAYQDLRLGEVRSLFVPIKVNDEAGGITVARLQITVLGTKP